MRIIVQLWCGVLLVSIISYQRAAMAQEIDSGYYAEGVLLGITDASQVPVGQPSSPAISDPPAPLPTGSQGTLEPDPNVAYLEGPGWMAWIRTDVPPEPTGSVSGP